MLLSALGRSPDAQAEQLLGELVETDPRFYGEYSWLQAVVSRGTASSAKMLLRLICTGKLTGKKKEGIDEWTLTRYLAGMVRDHPEIQTDLIRCYENQSAETNRSLVARTIAELAHPDALLALVRGYARDGRAFDGTLHHSVEKVAIRRDPVDGEDGNTYELHSVDITDLRKKLFAMIKDNPAEASVAEACLTAIDELRDEYGRTPSEPRHPDIESGRPWPLEAGAMAERALCDNDV